MFFLRALARSAAVGAENTAIPGLWHNDNAAAFAGIKTLLVVFGHFFRFDMSALGAGEYGIGFEIAHK